MFHRWHLWSVLALGAAGVLLMPDSSFGQVPSSDYYQWRNRYDFPAPGFPPPVGWYGRQTSSTPAFPSYSQPPVGYQAYYAPAANGQVLDTARSTPPLGNGVLLTVEVPERNAQIWIDGSRTSQTGTVRRFLSPPINPGSNYTYDIKAQWTENGHTVDQTRTVRVRAGERVNVDFNTQALNGQRPSQRKGGS